MVVTVREMAVGELDLIIRYFHEATPEFLETLGVDPSRLPVPAAWRERLEQQCGLPMDQRASVALIWLLDEEPCGFSTADKIVFGERANMHLHVIDPERRRRGLGVEAVRKSVALYFELLRLRTLFCEPNAFNVAPNRTLQRAGFKYLKTHMTVPGPLNYHQAVTRWAIER
jgi:RimJ/RimL family protein N-acetyltransferase